MNLCSRVGCEKTTRLIAKGDPKRGIVAGTYRKYCSHECYLADRSDNRVKRCPRDHKYKKTKGGRNRCELCGAAKRLAKKVGRPFDEVLLELENKPKRCPICKKKDKGDSWHRLVPDHDHATGVFRGWLCGSCNKALGMVSDNPKILRRLAKYLEQ